LNFILFLISCIKTKDFDLLYHLANNPLAMLARIKELCNDEDEGLFFFLIWFIWFVYK